MVNSLGDYSKTKELKCETIKQLTQYLGGETNFILGNLSTIFVPGVYRYVFYTRYDVAVAGTNRFNYTISGLPTNISFDVLPIQYYSGDGIIYSLHQSDWAITAGILTIPIQYVANNPTSFLFKCIVILYPESQ